MRKRIFIAVILTALAGAAAAAEVTRPGKGGYCFTNHLRIDNGDIPWNCEHLGKVTLREIYEKGFRVVGMYESTTAKAQSGYPMLIIEEQR